MPKKRWECATCWHASYCHYEGTGAQRVLRTSWGHTACDAPGCPCTKYVPKERS